LVVLVLAGPREVSAGIWKIIDDRQPENIQAAIDSASHGDTILVGPGHYVTTISFKGKSIILRSIAGPQVTVLDGRGQGPVVSFVNAENRQAELEGFTITGGRAYAGAGILCMNGSPIIKNNVIADNHAVGIGSYGGGVAIGTRRLPQTPSPFIVGNLIARNTAEYNGGGMSAYIASPTVQENMFVENECGHDGGGLRVHQILVENGGKYVSNEFWRNRAGDHGGGASLFAENTFLHFGGNLVAENVALGSGQDDTGSGGGVWAVIAPGLIEGNTIVDNSGFGEGAHNGGGLALFQSGPGLEISRNIIANNEGGGVVCRSLTGSIELNNNIVWRNDIADCPDSWTFSELDPQFCDPGAGDYSVATSSPALQGETIGAFSSPGCSPGTPMKHTSWGRLKSLYRRGGL
jgi:hypothetical protein